MGDVLIMTRWPQECFAGDEIRACDADGHVVPLYDLYLDRPDTPSEQMLAEHPEAFVEVAVPVAHTWLLPPEPLRPDWHRDAARVAEQNETVRASLEAFLNRQLAELRQRMRSGWWLMGDVRVRVEVSDTVPEEGDHG